MCTIFQQSLQKKYPHISIETLNDLLSVSAKDHQYKHADEKARSDTERRLQSYLLQDIPKQEHDPARRRPDRERMKVVIIGETGSGKSSVSNTLLQKNTFSTSSSATPETTKEQVSTSANNEFLVVDTPGSWTPPKQVSQGSQF